MACNANQLLADGQANFGTLSRLELLQVIADLSAQWLVNLSPGSDVSAEAVWGRAISSGIVKSNGNKETLALIAQKLCDTLNNITP